MHGAGRLKVAFMAMNVGEQHHEDVCGFKLLPFHATDSHA